MVNNLQCAIELLRKEDYTCVLCKESIVYTSRDRGIKPLLNWLDHGIDIKGFSVADKVVGRGAAFLYVLLEVKELYARVVSEAALEVLYAHHISVTYEKKVEFITNRSGTGVCPMEQATKGIESPLKALEALRHALKELS